MDPLPVLVAVLGIMAIEGMWLAFLTYMMYKRAVKNREEAMKEAWLRENQTIIDEIFLLHKSGVLIKHYTRRLKPDVDSDVLSAMLVAVQEFVRDSFRGEKGGLDEIKFGELRILIVRGRSCILAAVVSGKHPENILPEMRKALVAIEESYGEELMDWDGIMERVTGIDQIMKKLIEGGYGQAVQMPKPKKASPVWTKFL